MRVPVHSPLLQALQSRVLVCDGAMGTQIQARNPTLEDFAGKDGCNELLVLTRPDIIRSIHDDYLDAGADIIETATFGALPWVLDEYEIGEKTEEICYAAAIIARQAADDRRRAGLDAFVLGAIGPGTKLSTLGNISFDDVEDGYFRGFRELIRGGSDALLAETCQDFLNVKAIVAAMHRALESEASDIPLFVQVTIEQTGTMLLGTEMQAAINFLESFPRIVGIGINCATGPEEMAPHVRTLSNHSRRLISVQPNAGLPVMENGEGVYKLSPETLATHMKHFVLEFGANIVGGCCGTTPAHIRAVADAVRGLVPRRRSETPHTDDELLIRPLVGCSSLYQFQPYDQTPSFLIVGEKTNANGSKAFRDALAAEDLDAMTAIARDQEAEGSHLLDVCTAYVGRDEVRDMDRLLYVYAQQVTIPLMIDTTELNVVEQAMKRVPGKCLINSIHFEDGGERLHKVLEICRKYGAAVVALTIDENGMAKTAASKVSIAERILEQTRAYGLADEDVFIDALTFTLGSGDEEFRSAGIETLNAIRELRTRHPRVNTILGVSNISFGLKPGARHILNSVFLAEARNAGLTSAIIHAGKIIPENRADPELWSLAKKLVFDERSTEFDPLHALMAKFELVKQSAEDEEQAEQLSVEDRLKKHIINGIKQNLTLNLDEALQVHKPLDVINNILLDGMKTVGELFGAGKMQLPFVLQSAEVMKAAVKHLEPLMEKVEGQEKGSILLATVAGDVHDIGKNLVDIILSNNGYRVVNIGIKQPISNILAEAEKHNVQAIGMSGLLVKSTVVMKDNLLEMNERGKHTFPVLLGGAALTRSYVEDDLRRIYQGSVWYAQDAFEGLHIMQDLESQTELADQDDELPQRRVASHRLPESDPELYAFTGVRSDIATDVQIPIAPFFGSKHAEQINIEDIYPYINEVALFRGQWGFKRPTEMNNAQFTEFLEREARPVFVRMKEELRDKFHPKAAYGFFKAQSSGNDLHIYDETGTQTRATFKFPRQSDNRRLCLADFFASVESGRMDVCAFQIVTIGSEISEFERKLFEDGKFQDYLFVHGMGVETAEALAEFWHRKMREMLGIANEDSPEIKLLFSTKYRGCRYSFGYPACPNLEDQRPLFDLLQPGKIGIELSDEFMLIPEQSTSALICHHPEAKYFVIR